MEMKGLDNISFKVFIVATHVIFPSAGGAILRGDIPESYSICRE